MLKKYKIRIITFLHVWIIKKILKRSEKSELIFAKSKTAGKPGLVSAVVYKYGTAAIELSCDPKKGPVVSWGKWCDTKPFIKPVYGVIATDSVAAEVRYCEMLISNKKFERAETKERLDTLKRHNENLNKMVEYLRNESKK